VIGGAQQQHAAGAQHPAQLRQARGRVGYVLDRLARPHHVKARIRQRQAGFAVHNAHIQTGLALARPPHRLGGGVEREHLGAGAGQRRRELAFAAAGVEHARYPPDPLLLAPHALQ